MDVFDYNGLFLGTFQNNNKDVLSDVIKAAFDCGIRGFDTAPSYHTEKDLGDILQACMNTYNIARDDIFVSDKIDAIQMYNTDGNVEEIVKQTLSSMYLSYYDILFIHWPIQEYVMKTWECLNVLKEAGLIKKIGLSNVRTRHLESIIQTTGIKPDIIQIERHPLRTCNEEVNYCHSNNIKIQAYSPLCRMDLRLRNNDELKRIAQKYGKDVGQIILRWHFDTGVTPVFMTHKTLRLANNNKLYDFCLNKSEIDYINSLDLNYKIFLESIGCPAF